MMVRIAQLAGLAGLGAAFASIFAQTLITDQIGARFPFGTKTDFTLFKCTAIVIPGDWLFCSAGAQNFLIEITIDAQRMAMLIIHPISYAVIFILIRILSENVQRFGTAFERFGTILIICNSMDGWLVIISTHIIARKRVFAAFTGAFFLIVFILGWIGQFAIADLFIIQTAIALSQFNLSAVTAGSIGILATKYDIFSCTDVAKMYLFVLAHTGFR